MTDELAAKRKNAWADKAHDELARQRAKRKHPSRGKRLVDKMIEVIEDQPDAEVIPLRRQS